MRGAYLILDPGKDRYKIVYLYIKYYSLSVSSIVIVDVAEFWSTETLSPETRLIIAEKSSSGSGLASSVILILNDTEVCPRGMTIFWSNPL